MEQVLIQVSPDGTDFRSNRGEAMDIGIDTFEATCRAVQAVFEGRMDSADGNRVMTRFVDQLTKLAKPQLSGPNAALDAADAAQETFVTMWLTGFRRYGERSCLGPVVRTILYSKCMDLNRRRKYELGLR